jgi:hypothetical protein
VSAAPLGAQLINLFAAILLLLAFAMLAQRRVVSLIDLFAAQGFVLALSTAVVAYTTSQPHLYQSAVLTLLLKVSCCRGCCYRLVRRLDVRWEFEGLINIPTTMLIGIVLVVFVVQPRAADLAAREHGHALDARHRDGVRHAGVPDDDHAAQGHPAGDRLPGDGERAALRRHQRDVRHADGRRARHRARRAGRHADPRRVLLPDPRAVRQPRSQAPRELRETDE